MNHTQAIIITIGDELLIGQIIDTNSAWIAQQLNALGIGVLKRVAVGDTREAIIRALDDELPQADLVLLTGGLGPTSDDVTKPVLCDYFGGRLIVNEQVLEHVKSIFTRRNKPFLEQNRKQAEVPDVCTVIFNKMGTAPGMLFEKEGKIIVSMPGVPFEMKGMMTDTLLPLFSTRFKSEMAIVHRNILTFGEGESFLAERIKDIEAELPAHIRLAYLPSPYSVKLRLTASGTNEQELSAQTEQFRDRIAERVHAFLVGFEDLPLEAIVARQLTEQQLTLGLAESCTGGGIAHQLTQVNGASLFLKGSVVSYATEAKINILGIDEAFIREHGVVSERVAIAMARAAQQIFHSDIGLGITGILSEGAYEDHSPVGTVFVALVHGERTIAVKHLLHYDRIQNKETAVRLALYQLWRLIDHP